jgi:hypothetical protein
VLAGAGWSQASACGRPALRAHERAQAARHSRTAFMLEIYTSADDARREAINRLNASLKGAQDERL